MLPLEVVGPGGSLSTVLIATPYWRDASWRVSWQAATATAGSSCDRTATARVHRLGTAGSGSGGGLISSATEPKFVQCSFRSVIWLVYYVFVFVMLDIWPFSRIGYVFRLFFILVSLNS
jgi:hypothetical protein